MKWIETNKQNDRWGLQVSIQSYTLTYQFLFKKKRVRLLLNTSFLKTFLKILIKLAFAHNNLCTLTHLTQQQSLIGLESCVLY